MSGAGRLVQIFVSIPEARPFYKRDFLNACCFPSGARLTLAFRRKWISDSALEHFRALSAPTAPSRAWIIFCEELRHPHSATEVYQFHPVREAKLTKVVSTDAGATLEVELGAFLLVGQADIAAVHVKLMTQAVEHPNYKRVHGQTDINAKFVRYVPDNLDLSVDPKGWELAIERLGARNGLDDSLFFAFTNDAVTEYPIYPSHITGGKSGARTEIEILRGTELPIKLYGLSGQRATFAPPEAKSSDSCVKLAGPYVRQYLSGYSIEYSLHARSGWENDSAMLTIALPPKSEDPVVPRSPEFAIHVKVSPRKWLIAAVVGSLILGTAGTAVDKDFLDAVGLAKELAPVFKAVGLALFAIGAFLGFRKLPGQG